jgi:hypothetical protein
MGEARARKKNEEEPSNMGREPGTFAEAAETRRRSVEKFTA